MDLKESEDMRHQKKGEVWRLDQEVRAENMGGLHVF